ncbi:MAG: hypothetical protein AAF467_06470 [Actinomycetota bacterium]
MNSRITSRLIASAVVATVAVGAGVWRYASAAPADPTAAVTGSNAAPMTDGVVDVADAAAMEMATTADPATAIAAPMTDDEIAAMAAEQCLAVIDELQRREEVGELTEADWGRELTEEEYEQLTVPAPAFDGDVLAADERPTLTGFGPADATALSNDEIIDAEGACWESGVLAFLEIQEDDEFDEEFADEEDVDEDGDLGEDDLGEFDEDGEPVDDEPDDLDDPGDE